MATSQPKQTKREWESFMDSLPPSNRKAVENPGVPIAKNKPKSKVWQGGIPK